MLSMSDQASFRRDGFLIVPEAFDPSIVAGLRAAATEAFDHDARQPGDSPQILFDIASRYSWARELMADRNLLEPLRSVLGDNFAFLPEMSVHDSMFGGWHKDTGAQEMAGCFFHLEPTYLMVEAAIYLQDNGPYGGGLDVLPGSHLIRRRAQVVPEVGRSLRERALRKLAYEVGKLAPDPFDASAVSLPSRAGDLVLFDFRIDHRATPPSACPASQIPRSHRKLALFFACSRNNEHVESYKRFILSRDDYVYLRNHKYPESVVELARDHAVTLA